MNTYFSSFIRFLISGGLNTALTFVLYILLLNLFPYKVSYSIAFVTGIAIAYFLGRYFVFDCQHNQKRILFFPPIYVLQFILGLLIVHVWVEYLNFDSTYASLFAVAILTPITFGLNRWVFTPGSSE